MVRQGYQEYKLCIVAVDGAGAKGSHGLYPKRRLFYISLKREALSNFAINKNQSVNLRYCSGRSSGAGGDEMASVFKAGKFQRRGNLPRLY